MPSLDLTKKAEKVGLVLEKKAAAIGLDLSKLPPIAVKAALDISYSMDDEYRDGSVQSVFDQCLGVALKIDDDGDIDVYAFDTRSYRAPTATADDFGTYIGTRPKQGKFGMWPQGGTSYGPVLEQIVKDSFGGAPKGILGGIFGGSKRAPVGNPVMVLFFTDGDTGDGDAAGRNIKKCQDERTNVYFNLIGVGNGSSFSYLKRLADDYDNCGFTHLRSARMSDDELYDKIINTEFLEFIKGQGVPA
jgi:hypothetical protein